jgi:restriction endonuclease S subunit
MSRTLVDSGIKWIGKIPSDWEIIPNKRMMYKVKNICEKYDGQDVLSLTMNGVIKRDLDNPMGKMPESFDGYQFIDKGNLIMCLFDMDVTPRCIGLSNYNGITSPAYTQFKLYKSNYNRYYYYYYLYLDNSKELLHLSKNLRSSLTDSQLGEINIPVPPENEAIRISNYLDNRCEKIDDIINDNNREIELLEECKTSYISELIMTNNSKQLKACNKEWITFIDDNCIVKKLKYVSKLQTGTTPSGFEDNTEDDKIDWFTPSDFDKLELTTSSRKLSKNLIDEKKVYPKNSTLIIGIGGTLGKIGYLDKSAYSNQQITAVIPNKDIYPKYLTYNLIGAMKYIKDTCPYTTMPILSNSYLSNILICYRDYSEQVKIANKIDEYISNIDLVIDYRKKIIEKLEEYKKSLIYEVVTGKKEV